MKNYCLVLKTSIAAIVFGASAQWAQAVPKMIEPPETHGLSLKQIGRIALENSPAFLTAKANYEISKLQFDNGYAAFFPSLDLTSSAGPLGYTPNNIAANSYASSSTASWTSSTALALTESLWDNGETSKKYQVLSLSKELARLQLTKARGQVLLSIVQAYCDWSYSLLQLTFTNQYSQELTRQFNLASAQYHQGLKTRSDFLRFQAQVQRSQLDSMAAERVVELNRITLTSAMGISQNAESKRNLELSGLDNPTKLIKVKSLEMEADELIENRILATRKQISDKQIALIKSKNSPQIYLTAAAQYGSSSYIQTGQSWNDNQQTSWNALLTLKFNLWDMGTRDRNIEIQSQQESVAQLELKNQKLSSEKDLLTFQQDLLQMQKREQVTASLVNNEENSYEQIERDYRQGKITYLDLTQALSAVLDARSRKLRVDFDSLILYSKWKYFKGTLDEDTLEE